MISYIALVYIVHLEAVKRNMPTIGHKTVSYVDVITHAFLPAVISYIALVYIVHLEAVKRNMPTIGHKTVSTLRTIIGMFVFFAAFAALCYGVQYPVAGLSPWYRKARRGSSRYWFSLPISLC